jgi:hypothetical protein
MELSGNELLARSIEKQGFDTFFYLMGYPILDLLGECLHERNLNGIDVRHEQSAALMAQAHSRLTQKPGLCMAISGPGTTNLVTGIANAYADATPVVALLGVVAVALGLVPPEPSHARSDTAGEVDVVRARLDRKARLARQHRAVETLLEAGMRPSQICDLRRRDVTFDPELDRARIRLGHVVISVPGPPLESYLEKATAIGLVDECCVQPKAGRGFGLGRPSEHAFERHERENRTGQVNVGPDQERRTFVHRRAGGRYL